MNFKNLFTGSKNEAQIELLWGAPQVQNIPPECHARIMYTTRAERKKNNALLQLA
jgi:hypothetical protein